MVERDRYEKAKELMLVDKRSRRMAINMLREMPNYPPAQFLLAVLLKDNKKVTSKKSLQLFMSAFPYYQKTTEKDEAERQTRLAAYYYFGDIGVEKNLQEAVKWFSIAADNGDSKAQLFLAKCYAMGYGIEKDMDKSIYWVKKAAERNEPEALTTLGHIYVNGQYVNQDIVKGVELLKKAIILGDKRALKLYRSLILAKIIEK